jgi:hypothetical protein
MPNLKSVMAGPALSAGGDAPSGDAGPGPGEAAALRGQAGAGVEPGGPRADEAGPGSGRRRLAPAGPATRRRRRRRHRAHPSKRSRGRGVARGTPPAAASRPIARRALRQPARAAAQRPMGIVRVRRRTGSKSSAGEGRAGGGACAAAGWTSVSREALCRRRRRRREQQDPSYGARVGSATSSRLAVSTAYPGPWGPYPFSGSSWAAWNSCPRPAVVGRQDRGGISPHLLFLDDAGLQGPRSSLWSCTDLRKRNSSRGSSGDRLGASGDRGPLGPLR